MVTNAMALCNTWLSTTLYSLHWRHNDHDGVSSHQPHGCLLNRLSRRRSKKTSKLRVTGLLCGEFTGTGEFSAKRASYVENVSIWWRHHGRTCPCLPGWGIYTCTISMLRNNRRCKYINFAYDKFSTTWLNSICWECGQYVEKKINIMVSTELICL